MAFLKNIKKIGKSISKGYNKTKPRKRTVKVYKTIIKVPREKMKRLSGNASLLDTQNMFFKNGRK